MMNVRLLKANILKKTAKAERINFKKITQHIGIRKKEKGWLGKTLSEIFE